MKKDLEQKILNQKHQLELIETKVKSQENERKQIAEDLHDEIAPFLMSVNMLAKKAKLKALNEEQYDLNDKMEGMINESILSIRQLSHSLHPAVLDAFGFRSAVEDLANKYAKSQNIIIAHELGNFDISFEHEDELALFRLMQELITNAIKHAGAQQFNIKLDNDKEENLSILISHNGSQYSDEDYKSDLKSKNGIGLLNINDRLSLLKGHIKYDYNHEKNLSEVILTIPLKTENHGRETNSGSGRR